MTEPQTKINRPQPEVQATPRSNQRAIRRDLDRMGRL